MGRGSRVLVAVLAAAALVGAGPAGAPAIGGTPTEGPPALVRDRVLAQSIAPAPANPAVPSAPTALPQPSGRTSLVSANTARSFANGLSTTPSISATGRYVAFASSARDLIPGGTLASSAIYLRDRSTGTTIQIPAPGLSSVPRGGNATEPSISADGNVIAFTYRDTPDPASPSSVVVWDRKTDRTTLVSNPLDATDASHEPVVSGNGRFVAYTSTSPRLITRYSSEYSDVWRFDRTTGKTVLVSQAVSEGTVSGDSHAPSISFDGHLVAFASSGGQSLVAGANGKGDQVYLRDVSAGATTEVSVGPGGAASDAPAGEPSLSDTGLFVAFSSSASTLLGPGGPATLEVYRRDLAAGQNELVSVQDNGAPFPSPARQPAISRDGRMVAYVVVGGALANALVERQSSAILLRDVTAGQTAVITVARNGSLSQSISAYPAVGGAGRFVAFASGGADLVAGDLNKQPDVFVRDLPPIPRLNPPAIDFGTRAVGVAPSNAAGVLMNAGWGPMTMKTAAISGTNAGDYSVLADGCNAATLYRGEACTVTVGFAPKKPGARAARLLISMNAPSSPAALTLKGRGSQAVIVLDPPMGPQGIVVVATGDHFPANAEIQLTWSVGITPTLPVVKADGRGHWQMQVLVFHHDVVGPRNLVATWVGGPEFPTVAVPMLVTVRTVAPPGFGVGGPPGSPLMLLFRG